MDKYKIISVFLAFALCANLVRLVYVSNELKEETSLTPAEEMLNLIESRKSVRTFTSDKISRAQIDTLLHAAMAAPSGHDMRPWKFIVIKKKELLKTLGKQLSNAKMLLDAPAAIVVCGDMSITDKNGNPSGNWVMDCSAATQNILLTAEAMGLGAVWTGAYPYEERMDMVREVLNLPENLIPLNVIPVGYPAGNAQPKDKYDKSRIRYNGF